jgi:4-alpha-glucanotransferase
LIDLNDLVTRGWLATESCPPANGTGRVPATKGIEGPPAGESRSGEQCLAEDKVDFDAVSALKEEALRVAHEGWQAHGEDPRFQDFFAANSVWLDDYALYHALKDSRGGLPWYQWEHELVVREPGALAAWRERLQDGISYHKFVQYAFEIQWQALRAACKEHGIVLMGDVPIFVAHDSADVWARPDLFYLDERGMPLVVAGVPPDYFSETGQLWGNPLYRWDVHAADDYSWWAARLSLLLRRVDVIRIDHFRGFEAYWEIPAGSATAASGRWVPGPGRHFFEAMRRRVGSLPLVAEDLGLITPPVEALRDEFDLPGMRVLQFGFGPDQGADKALPHRHVPHCVAYTGTHDNDTTKGWFTSTHVATTQSTAEIEAERAFALRYLNSNGEEFHWDMIRATFSSVADTAIIPLQDILGLDSNARMNVPGTAEGNWTWRFRKGQIDERTQARLAELTAIYSRWNGPIPEGKDPRKNSSRRSIGPA